MPPMSRPSPASRSIPRSGASSACMRFMSAPLSISAKYGTCRPLWATAIRTIGRLNPCGSFVYGSFMLARERDDLLRDVGYGRFGEAFGFRLLKSLLGRGALADYGLVVSV